MRTGIALSAAAGLLLTGAGSAHAAGWADEKFPDSPGAGNSYLSTVASDGETTWALGAEEGSTPQNQESQAFQRGPEGWKRVPVPNVGNVNASTMVGPNDVWAAGELPKDGALGGVVHWDGEKWSEVPVAAPPEGRSQSYTGMTSFASDDVWMVGRIYDPDSVSFPTLPSIQHWDGEEWSRVSLTQRAPTPHVSLTTIGGSATDDLWAIGDSHYQQVANAIAKHWDGSGWTNVPMPKFEGAQALEFSDVVAKDSNDVHVVGSATYFKEGGRVQEPIAMHWNGEEWTHSEVPDTNGHLSDVTLAGDQLWAFGNEHHSGNAVRGYALRYDGGVWTEAEAPDSSSMASGTELADGSLLVVGAAGTDSGQEPHGWRYES